VRQARSGRAARGDHASQAQRRPATAAGCRGNARSLRWPCPEKVASVTRPLEPPPSAQGSCIRSRSEASGDCITLRHKTHSTASSDEVMVAYPWHPWVGRLVRVHEVVERTSGAQARCNLVGAGVVWLREIPAWMLDAVVCRPMRVVSEPVAALCALAALRSLLSQVMDSATAATAAVAFAAHRHGERHATPRSPAADAGASTRSLPGEPCTEGLPVAGVDRPAGSGTTRADRVDDAPADHTRQRRGSGPRRRR